MRENVRILGMVLFVTLVHYINKFAIRGAQSLTIGIPVVVVRLYPKKNINITQ